MTSGIRATVGFDSADICPLAALSKASNTRISGITNSISTAPGDPTVTEFTLNEPATTLNSIAPIYSYSKGYRYRFSHEEDDNCPCALLGSNGSAPANYVANDGQLTIVFYARDYDHLQLIISTLKKNFDSLDIKRLIQSSPNPTDPTEILLDISNLTNRQIEVIQTAFEMGYFYRPRDANAEEVATALDIHASTFHEHLATIQTKVFRDILGHFPPIQPTNDSIQD